MRKNLLLAGLLLTTPMAASMARADQVVYWTNFFPNQIMQTNVTASTTTVVDNTGGTGNPDSLIFDPAGNIVYTKYGVYDSTPGQLRMYNPNTNTDSLIMGGFSPELVDVTLEPGGTTVLVSDRGNNQIDRVTLANGTVQVLKNVSYPNGLAYDASGRLFAATGVGLMQIDPVTGATIAVNANATGIDGLTWDSSSGQLWAADSCLANFDVTTLNEIGCRGSGGDGVEGDGNGNILTAVYNNGIESYNIATDTQTLLASAAGIDDLAPVSGLGAPQNSPEPASLTLLAMGVAGLGVARRRRG